MPANKIPISSADIFPILDIIIIFYLFLIIFKIILLIIIITP
tara:strand:- start:1364 stop:1489 length:126 start_codon:yes stop_codon:yes gene_type:complete